ncbi:MAG: hypothetical protein K2H71_02500 [Muribaculaceae bacterium]|nr:hypothetical protein [Muribaculaceae bacterium]
MKKEIIIKFVQSWAEEHNVQAYPTQDYYLRPVNNQYGNPSGIPFPQRAGVACVFDQSGDLIYVFKHTSWHNHFSGPKVSSLESIWIKAIPNFIVSLILEGDSNIDLSVLADKLKKKLIEKAHPCENKSN